VGLNPQTPVMSSKMLLNETTIGGNDLPFPYLTTLEPKG